MHIFEIYISSLEKLKLIHFGQDMMPMEALPTCKRSENQSWKNILKRQSAGVRGKIYSNWGRP
jgi:hypothetical protein